MISTWFQPWPLQIRFWLSEAAFERELERVRAGEPWAGPKWVGWFPVGHVSVWAGEERVCFVVGNSVVDPVAICHDSIFPTSSVFEFRITGAWYVMEL